MFFKKFLFALLVVPGFMNTSEFKLPKITAHRGASAYRPENTLSAFEYAVQMGAQSIEFDVWLTKDNEVVIIHDKDLSLYGKPHLKVNHLTLEELKKEDAGSWFSEEYCSEKVPTFDELLALMANYPDVTLLIDIKEQNDKIVDFIIEKLKLRKTKNPYLLESFERNIITYLDLNYPKCPKAFLMDREVLPNDIEWAKKYHINTFAINHMSLNGEIITLLRDQGMQVYSYTINDTRDVEKLDRMGGIDGIISDQPDLLELT